MWCNSLPFEDEGRQIQCRSCKRSGVDHCCLCHSDEPSHLIHPEIEYHCYHKVEDLIASEVIGILGMHT
jgi:hypothetical protein